MAEITPEAKKTDNITNDLVEIVQPSRQAGHAG